MDQSLGLRKGPRQATEPIDQIIADVNANLEEQGAAYRLVEVWMFTIGSGRPANRRLQRGTRWVPGDSRRTWGTGTDDINFVLDVSDLTGDVSSANALVALRASFDTWSAVPNTFLDFVEVADDGLNHDFLDNFPTPQTFPPCTFPGVFDFAALAPNADVIMGGWLPREYFDCLTPLGGAFILGVTWTFGFGTDVNNDGYPDTALKEIYYNEEFPWVTTGSVIFGDDIDIESVSLHENGHAVDLGHFGGPPPPLTLKPNGRIFSPEAVMNPAYFGGERRELLPTDAAGYYTLWADGAGRQ